MIRQAAALSYAIRLRVILKYLGYVCAILAVLTLAPLGVSLSFGDTDISWRYVTVIVGLGMAGAILVRLPTPSRVQANEGMVLVALTFLLAPLAMTYPMMAFSASFMDALFEAISGSTTTGLSTFTTVEDAPPTFLFARAWMQWYGGLGIVSFSLALLSQSSMITEGLGVTEAEADDLIGSTKAHMRRVLIVYGVLTALGIGAVILLGASPFNATLYTFAAVSTGGFAPHDTSLAGLEGRAAAVAVTLVCVLGAMPLTWYHQLSRQRGYRSVRMLEPTAILISAALLTLCLGASLGLAKVLPWSQAFYHAPLMAVSAQSTAGFSTMNLAELNAFSKALMIPAMALGGGIGSTSGGFKILRFLILLRLLQTFIVRTSLPEQAVLDIRLNRRRLDHRDIHDALLLIVLFVVVVVLSWLIFVAMGYDPLDALFEVVSATGTVGLSVGVTSAELPPLLKGVLCVDMLMGRLEILAWLVLCYPGTWLGRRREAS